MTEEEWLGEICPSERLQYVGKRKNRKMRLLCCACCRLISHLIPSEYRDGVETAEKFADGMGSQVALTNANTSALSAIARVRGPSREYRVMQSHALQTVVGATVERYDLSAEDANPERLTLGGVCVATRWNAHLRTTKNHKVIRTLAVIEVELRMSRLVEEIFGNPFRPVTLNSSWLTPTALTLATNVYEDRSFDRLPVLADALQDAGCDNEDILNHCRQPGEHVRGCWVVDLLLGQH